MESIRNIVIVSKNGESPARLSTQIDPVKFTKSIEMAITSICHGEVYNIHEYNNHVHFSFYYKFSSQADAYDKRFKSIQIKPGCYQDRFSIIDAIDSALQAYLKNELGVLYDEEGIKFNIRTESRQRRVIIKQNNVFIEEMGEDTPWSLLQVDDIGDPISNDSFDNQIEIAFLYANIVENSYINGKKSRNLSVLPLKTDCGYTFFEFSNPIYVQIDVKEFNIIFLEIRDMNGELVKFDPESRTVISLHLKTQLNA